MELHIKGKAKLKGEVEISTSKNSILPILVASLLSDEETIINKVPIIKDVIIINEVLKQLGLKVEFINKQVIISGSPQNNNPSYDWFVR